MWAEADRRITAFPPEICRSDSMPVVLECALWGATELSRISWLDEPSVAGWNAATRLLEAMGCIKNGTITEKGKIVLQFGVHPRAACVALSGVSGAVPVAARYAAASDAEYHSLYADLNRRLNRLSFRQRQICSIRFLSQNGTDDGQRQAAKNTILHELLHTVKGCKGHKGQWKELAAKVNRRLPQYTIKRTTSEEEKGFERTVRVRTNRYTVKCSKCGREYHREKESKVIQHPEKYRCGACNSPLVRVK